MPISDPRDRFFYPHHTHMKDTYNLNYDDIRGDVYGRLGTTPAAVKINTNVSSEQIDTLEARDTVKK